MDSNSQNPDHQHSLLISPSHGNLGQRETLENTAQVLECLQYLDLSEGLTQGAAFGYYLILESAIEALRHTQASLQPKTVNS